MAVAKVRPSTDGTDFEPHAAPTSDADPEAPVTLVQTALDAAGSQCRTPEEDLNPAVVQ